MTAKTKTVAAIIGMIVGTGVALAALTSWAWVLTHHEALRNLALVAAGAIAVPLAIWRAWVAERQAETARRSLLNERDQKAAEMLGSTLLSVRLGGIYALQNLAAEHPPHYHLGVMRQFCAFVRGPQNPTLTDASPPAGTAPPPIPKMLDSGARPDHHARRGATDGDAASEPVREDVHAVMDAIAARSNAGIEVEQQERFSLDLSGANLCEWRFSEANLSEANLSGADLSRAKLFEADLLGADLSGADLSGADLFEADLSWADLSWAKLFEADLLGADLSEANLSGANLSGAKLFRADLSGVNLSGVNLSGANLSGANLSGVNLSGVNLSGVDLSGADLSRADLSGADLSGADLSGADLSGADLSGADLSRVNLSEADLSRADLSRVNLSRADLSGADLSGADLSGADLSRAKLSAGTVITQEQLDKTVAVPTKKSPIFIGDVRDAKTEARLNWRQRTP